MKLKILAGFVLIILFVSLASAQQNPSFTAAVRSGSSVDWVQFHFDSALDGYNPYETILSPANVGNVTLKWSYAPAEGRVEGQPAVVNGVMYFTTSFYPFSHKAPTDSLDAIYALNADTGALIWKYGIDGPAFGSPAVANGVVYVSGVDNLFALDANTGALLWQYGLTYTSQYCSPTVVNNIVYFASGPYVYALNATSGALIWRYTTAGTNPNPPAVTNGIVYVNSGAGTVYALNANTGALIWSKQLGGSLGPPRSLAGTLAGQAVANGVLYVGIQGKPGLYTLYALDAGTGAVRWSKLLASLYFETPAVANGVVYVVSGGMVYALNAATGAVIWQAAGYGNSPIVANGVVYTGTWIGTGEGTGYGVITAFNANTGAQLWNYQSDGSGEYDFFPTPAVVNGMIYGSRIANGSGSQVGAWSLPN
jgi:outer membrane protein assembly factor BamB